MSTLESRRVLLVDDMPARVTHLSDDPGRRARAIIRGLIAVVGLVVIALWAVVAVSSITTRKAAMEHASIEGHNLAAAFADEVAHILDGVVAGMEIVAQRMRAEPDRRPDIYAWARDIPMLSGATVQGVIIGPDGWLIGTTLDAAPAPLNLGDREHFRVHLDGHFPGVFIGKPVLGRVSRQVTIQITRRVDAEDGRFLGVIMFALSPGHLTNLYSTIDLGARGVLTLAGLDGIIRARFTRDHLDGLSSIGESVASGPPPTVVAAGEGFFVRDSLIDGMTRLFAYRRVGSYPLTVTVGLDLSEVFAAANAYTLMIAAIAAVATVLLLSLVAYLVREIRRRTANEIALAQERTNLEATALELTVSKDRAEAALRDNERITRELHGAQSQLVTTARQAGMAEIANNVLHNVGNVLNSVNVSAGLVNSKMRVSKALGLAKAVELMNEHEADLGDFLTQDARGKLLPGYLNKLVAALTAERQSIVQELGSLTTSVDHIKDIVATQQSYAGAASVLEPVQVRELLEDALRMNAGALARHQVTVVREFADVPLLMLDKSRVLQILVNLIGNAKQAMDGVTDHAHQMTLRVGIADLTDGRSLRICVEDEGEGIAPENLARLFVHGFTTRKSGHGFGLHSSALAAKEMGGTLTAQSDGLGKGAAFTLDLPIQTSLDLQ
jgi:two-component system NtrC family sensor kinase